MLGETLRFLRISRNVSQELVANLLNITRQAYSAYERSVSIPDAKQLELLADYFAVTTDYLLGRQLDKVEGKKMPADLKKILANQQLMFDGEELDEDDKYLISQIIEQMYIKPKRKLKSKDQKRL